MDERKIFAMHKRFGTCGVLRCKDCNHLMSGKYRGNTYHKCELYGMSHSEATDWRLSYQACGMYGIEQNMEHWTPILTQIIRSERQERPIRGQIEMEMIY